MREMMITLDDVALLLDIPIIGIFYNYEHIDKESTIIVIIELLGVEYKDAFDEDGDGYIDAMELKRVLDCLGLDKGWDMSAIEKMVKVADLNFDGKVDFGEFELMMG